MIDFLEYLKEVSPNFVAEAKKEEKEEGGEPKAKGGDKGPSMFAQFAKKKEGDAAKGDNNGKPEFPANFLKKDRGNK